MYLILKYNYKNVEVTRFSNEAVAVKSVDDSEWEHIKFRDFISLEDFKLIKSEERKVACNGWKLDFSDRWNYVEKDHYVVGIIVRGELYIVTDNNKPIIKSHSNLNDLKPRPKATVTTLLS